METKCIICNKFMDSSILGRHVRLSHKISSKDYWITYLNYPEIQKCKCGCGKEVEWYGLTLGFSQYLKGHNNYNRSNETNDKISETLKSKYLTGEIKVWNKGETKDSHPSMKRISDNLLGSVVTENVKEKISLKVKSLHENGEIYNEEWRNKLSLRISESTCWKYLGHHGKRNKYEIETNLLLSKLGFIQELEIPTPKGEKGTYSIGFAIPTIKLALELDEQNTHSKEKCIRRDREKDIWLKSLGWKVIRISFSSQKESTILVATRAFNKAKEFLDENNLNQKAKFKRVPL